MDSAILIGASVALGAIIRAMYEGMRGYPEVFQCIEDFVLVSGVLLGRHHQ